MEIHELLSFEGGEAACANIGGALAEIDVPIEEDMLSAVASNAGSWIGLRLDDNANEWKWINNGTVEDERSVIWAVRSVDNLKRSGKKCASIDRRGVRHNVHPDDCESRRYSICEFSESNLPEVCQVSSGTWKS